MPDLQAMGIYGEDLLTFKMADFAPSLPAYEERAREYARSLAQDNPRADVVFLHGVVPSMVSYVTTVFNELTWHVPTHITRHGFFNMTGVRRDVEKLHRNDIAMVSIPDRQGNTIDLSPDVLVDSFDFRGNNILLYNYEAMRGRLFESQRVYCTSLITRDAYRRVKAMDGDELLTYLGGDLHADDDFESVRLLTGKMVKDGVYPSAFIDVWATLHQNDNDKGYTKRQTDVFDSTVKFPKLQRPHRHTYFMVYGDVFGRVGTPLSIEINGNATTSSGIPFSNDYGLTMQAWVPVIRGYLDSRR